MSAEDWIIVFGVLAPVGVYLLCRLFRKYHIRLVCWQIDRKVRKMEKTEQMEQMEHLERSFTGRPK